MMGAPHLRSLPILRRFPLFSQTLVNIPNSAEQAVKKQTPQTDISGSGFIIGNTDPNARIAHLEQSVRFLQEQHRLMLGGLHTEIEALRERNRDLQFQLIFNKESTAKVQSTANEEINESIEEANLKQEIQRLEKDVVAAKSEARAAEARALQLQELVDAQTEKIRELDLKPCSCQETPDTESRAELRARLSDAERLVRRLRSDERRRREVLAGGAVTNLLFDGAAARHAHLQCMKNSLHASLRGSLDGYVHAPYPFPPVRAPDMWPEHAHEEFDYNNRGRRRPFNLPELATSPTHHSRSTVYVNQHARPRGNFEHKNRRPQALVETPNGKSPEELQGQLSLEDQQLHPLWQQHTEHTFPELKVVVAKLLPSVRVTPAPENGSRRTRRHHHRKLADHT